MCAFFGILGMGLSKDQCENCLVRLVTLYVNCVLKLQVCFALMSNLRDTILLLFMALFFYFWSSVSPSKKKKLQSSTIAVNINVGLLNQEWKKKSRCVVFMTIPSLDLSKKEGQTKILIFYPYFSVTSSQKKG